MVWIWAFLCGLPVGGLGFFALNAAPLAWLPLCAGAGGAAVALAAWLAMRFGSHASDRGRHVAQASSLGWAALPAGIASWLGLAPGAAISLAAISGVLVLAWFRAARTGAPGPGLARQGAAVLAALGFGACGFVGWAGLQAGASGGGGDGPFPEARSHYVYDLDARVPTQAIPRCEGAPRIVGTIPGGARPARAVDGALWFDAPDAEGLRQIRRRDPATREVDCFTCDQPGNNLRPTPSVVSRQVVFESDREATALRPLDRELYLLRASGPPPAVRLHRVTRDRGADLYGGVGPGGQALVWSAARSGSWAVVTAALGFGHGGITVGPANVLVPGGAGWVAPLAWSPDARSLALLRGGPRRLGRAELLDPATGETRSLDVSDGHAEEPHVAGAAFSADGGFLAVVSTRPDAWARSVPSTLGFLATPLELLGGPDAPAPLQNTALHVGEPRGVLRRVPLGEGGAWGHPTGVALSADGTLVFIGQRAGPDRGGEERILELDLCP